MWGLRPHAPIRTGSRTQPRGRTLRLPRPLRERAGVRGSGGEKTELQGRTAFRGEQRRASPLTPTLSPRRGGRIRGRPRVSSPPGEGAGFEGDRASPLPQERGPDSRATARLLSPRRGGRIRGRPRVSSPPGEGAGFEGDRASPLPPGEGAGFEGDRASPLPPGEGAGFEGDRASPLPQERGPDSRATARLLSPQERGPDSRATARLHVGAAPPRPRPERRVAAAAPPAPSPLAGEGGGERVRRGTPELQGRTAFRGEQRRASPLTPTLSPRRGGRRAKGWAPVAGGPPAISSGGAPAPQGRAAAQG